MMCAPQHWMQYVVWGVVILWLCPGALLRPSAAILALAWAIAEDRVCQTGNSLPISLYIGLDLMTIALIAATTWPISGPHAKRELAVCALFPVMWLTYLGERSLLLSATYAWWVLTVLTLAQFLIVGPWIVFARNRTIEGRRGLSGVRVEQ